jgi:3-dehydroquinate synthase
VVAAGGGVTGDLAGFVAGTYMRGIPFVQVPTTLLAMVDSSVGGKVAVDLRRGKNSSGLFHQPLAVLTDVGFLSTLPEDEFNNGMAEIVKHGVIRDAAYFGFIEKNAQRIKARDPGVVREMVAGSCRIKADVVGRDETEKGLRRILNFGHTVGHAVESLSHYRLKHGACVSFGMKTEAAIAARLGLLEQADLDRLTALLALFGSKDIPVRTGPLVRGMIRDKKNRRGRIVVVLPVKIGRVVVREFDADELTALLSP